MVQWNRQGGKRLACQEPDLTSVTGADCAEYDIANTARMQGSLPECAA